MTQSVFGKHRSNAFFGFLVRPTSHMPTWRREGFIACTAADHQMKMFWPQFWECCSSSIHMSVALPIHLLSSTYLASGRVAAAYEGNSGDPSPQKPFSAHPGGDLKTFLGQMGYVIHPSLLSVWRRVTVLWAVLSVLLGPTAVQRDLIPFAFETSSIRSLPEAHGHRWGLEHKLCHPAQLFLHHTGLRQCLQLYIFTWGSNSPRPRWSNLQSGPWPWRRWLLHMQLGGSSCYWTVKCTIVQTYDSKY